MSAAAAILLVLKASIVLSVFAIGLKAEFAHTAFLFRSPGRLARAVFAMNVWMPAMALAIGMVFDLHPAVKIALVVISVSPVPPIFPKKGLKAGGAGDYTIGLLVATALLAILTIPLTMEIVEWIVGIPLAMQATQVAILVFATIIAPLAAGIVVRKLAPGMSDRAAKPVGMVGMALLILSVLPVLAGSAHAVFSLVGDGTVLGLAAFALAGLVVGGPEPDNRPVLALAGAGRHPAVALAIAHANFPDQNLAASAVLLYLVVAGVLSAIYLAWVKRRRAVTVAPRTGDGT
jgi:BASS family bile acid:Na+ symporter